MRFTKEHFPKKNTLPKKIKKCLKEKNIPFEEGDWQTIDKDCERKKLNQNKFYELFRNKKSYQN